MAQAKKKPAVKAAMTPRFRVVDKDESPRTGGLNLGGLRKSTPKTGSKAKHPIVEVSEEAMAHLVQYLEHAQTFSDLNKLVGPKGSIKAQLAPHIKETYFRRFAGGAPDSTMLVDVNGTLVKLITKSRYSTQCPSVNEAGQTHSLLIEEAEHFRSAVLIKIDMDKIPAEKQQPLVDAITAAAGELAIEEGIDYTECVQPKPGFHEARTTLLTPERNIEIDALIPITAYPQL